MLSLTVPVTTFFKLVDSALAAQTQRSNRILQGLKTEGVAEPVVLWALSREARTLINIKKLNNTGRTKGHCL